MINKEIRKKILDFAKQNLIKKIKIKRVIPEKEEKEINFSTKGIKEAINQPHKFYNEKNKAILNIVSLIKTSEYIRTDLATKKCNSQVSLL